jgi:hypothetical protein
VFNTETKRTQILALAVVGMLLLAGCSSQSQLSEPQTAIVYENITDEAPTTATTQAPVTSSEPAANTSLNQRANETRPAGANLSQQARVRAEDLATSFFEDLPENKTERRQTGFEAANATCAIYRDAESITDTREISETGGLTKEAGRRISFASQIANEQFSEEIPTHTPKSLRQTTKDATNYVPLVSSYQAMSESACRATEERTDEALKDYYTATLVFGVDTMLVSTGAFYEPAFAGTRLVTNHASQIGLYRLRYLIGNRGWALAMSEVHWALRGSMLNTVSGLTEEAASMGWDLNEDGADVQLVAQVQGVNPATLTAAAQNQSIPTNTSWSFESANGSRTANVTVGNHTQQVAVRSGVNASSILDYQRHYGDMSDFNNVSRDLLNQTDGLTDITVSDIENGTGGIVDGVEDAAGGLDNATQCVASEGNSSEEDNGGGLLDQVEDAADEAADAVKSCSPLTDEGSTSSEETASSSERSTRVAD